MASKYIKSENVGWFTQKPGSVICGAVAIVNAKLWLGENVKKSELNSLVKHLDISIENDGISGSNLDRWISQKRNFGVKRIVQPKLSLAQSLLKQNSAFILRYIWEVEELRGAHYVFVCPGYKNKPLVANPHRLSPKGKYEKWRYFSTAEFSNCFKKQKIGNRYYPWIWPIKKPKTLIIGN